MKKNFIFTLLNTSTLAETHEYFTSNVLGADFRNMVYSNQMFILCKPCDFQKLGHNTYFNFNCP